MDADAYLRKQGWKGAGHSLDGHGRGIKKPLLIAHKQDQLGLGKKKAAHNVDDQWWMRAFDESLQNIGTGQESTLGQVREKGINRGGLYGFFVRGEGLAGTISTWEESSTSATEAAASSATTSGASTPPTSASDSGSTSESSIESESNTEETPKMSKAKNLQKRKRGQDDEPGASKKLKPDEAQARPAFDADTLRKARAVIHRIDREVKHELKVRSKRGEYGAYLDLAVHGKESKVTIDDPNKPGKKLRYKQARYQRQSVMRDAKKELRKAKLVMALTKGDLPNPENYTEEDYPKIEKFLDALEKQEAQLKVKEKEEKKQAKRKKRDEQIAVREDRKAAKKERKKDKSELKDTHSKDADTQSLVSAKLAKLTPSEKSQYEARAAAKNQSLETYILRRIQKKLEKRVEGNPIEETFPENMFFTDLEGNPNLTQALNASTRLDSEAASLEDNSCPIDSSLGNSRKIKMLSSPTRPARRKRLEQHSIENHAKAGKVIEEKLLSRGELKQKKIDLLTKQLLSDQGVDRGASKEQRDLARRKARKILKEEKRERTGGRKNKLKVKVGSRSLGSRKAKKRNEAAMATSAVAAALK